MYTRSTLKLKDRYFFPLFISIKAYLYCLVFSLLVLASRTKKYLELDEVTILVSWDASLVLQYGIFKVGIEVPWEGTPSPCDGRLFMKSLEFQNSMLQTMPLSQKWLEFLFFSMLFINVLTNIYWTFLCARTVSAKEMWSLTPSSLQARDGKGKCWAEGPMGRVIITSMLHVSTTILYQPRCEELHQPDGCKLAEILPVGLQKGRLYLEEGVWGLVQVAGEIL